MARPRRRSRPHHLTAHQRRVRAARKAARTRARMASYRGRQYRSRRRKAVAADFGINPRRYGRRVSNPRRRMSNPFKGFGTRQGVTKLVTSAGVGAAGAVLLDYLWQWGAPRLPVQLQSGYIGTVAKAAAAVGAGWLAGKAVGKPLAIAMSGGALTIIAYQLIHQVIASAAPQVAIPSTSNAATPPTAVAGLNAYMQPRQLGWVSPGATLRGLRGMGAYMPGRGMPVAPAMNRPGGSVSPSGLAMAGGY